MNPSISNPPLLSNEVALADWLIDRVVSSASGRTELDAQHNYPRDIFFIGNLRSRLDGSGPSLLPGELLNKLSPCSLGLELQVVPASDTFELTVDITWSFYFRVFPTLEQQRLHQLGHQNAHSDNSVGSPNAASNADKPTTDELDSDGAEDNADSTESESKKEQAPSRRRSRSDSLALRFRRLKASVRSSVPLRRDTSGAWAADVTALQEAVNAEVRRCLSLISDAADRYRAAKDADEDTRVPESAIQTQLSYTQFLQALAVEVRPAWSIEVAIATRQGSDAGDSTIFSLDVTNAAVAARNPNIEPFIFDVQSEVELVGAEAIPFKIDLAPRGFRYSKDLWGQGFNCAVEQVSTSRFRTSHTPIVRQARYVTREAPDAPFAELARDPAPILKQITTAMEEYRESWSVARDEYQKLNPKWNELHNEEFVRDLKQFEGEIERFRRGVSLIESDADCGAAFRLMNESFSRLGLSVPAEKRKKKWRLFQIVFIVSQVPAIHGLKLPSPQADAELETADVVYFPTGGGKTEAYLGTIVFHCFFDRLRGKSAGLTCWTRFPLRLLTLQQTQRMADAIGAAELVRAGSNDTRLSGKNVDGFAVGYFVGSEGTPNKLVPPDPRYPNRNPRDDVNWSIASDPAQRQRWKRVVTCPSCQTNTVSVEFDSQTVRLRHRCTNSACAFHQGWLPIYVVDTEIFRYLPTVVVGTVDKLAALGNQRKLSTLLGDVEGKCSVHGYFAGVCSQDGCRDRSKLRRVVPPGVSGPTLFVQDELHLLKEGLGTFDSHYETFVQCLVKELGQKRPIKIIASSATIEQFERQIEHLYGKDRKQARIFPGPGPRLAESFYARTLTDPQRIFVGILPHNKTVFNAILELIEYIHMGASDAKRQALAANDARLVERADLYQTSLTYFLANRQLNSIRTDLEGDTMPRLQESGYPPLQLHELTGSTSTADVTLALKKLETQLGPDDPPDAVLANQMVSHGVDIDRLNVMTFYGMPRSTAEYIQASSRVGRAHVGVVFLCFQSARERDQSHFKYFRKYHEYLGQLVEPVAINRWATYSIDRTMPGLFMAILLQLLARRLGLSSPAQIYMREVVQQKISAGEITAKDFESILRDTYINVGGGDAGSRAQFERQIPLKIRQFLDQILQPGGGDNFVSSALIPSPMMSLRDVEEAIPIEIDADGAAWLGGR